MVNIPNRFPPNGAHGVPQKHILKTPDEQVKADRAKLKQLEQYAEFAGDAIEKLKWQTAQLRVAINALGIHFKLTPEAMKEIVDAYYKAQETEVLAMTEDAKKKFMQDLKDGKVPEITAMPDVKSDAPPVVPFEPGATAEKHGE